MMALGTVAGHAIISGVVVHHLGLENDLLYNLLIASIWFMVLDFDLLDPDGLERESMN